jgi:hypothetical protein
MNSGQLAREHSQEHKSIIENRTSVSSLYLGKISTSLWCFSDMERHHTRRTTGTSTERINPSQRNSANTNIETAHCDRHAMHTPVSEIRRGDLLICMSATPLCPGRIYATARHTSVLASNPSKPISLSKLGMLDRTQSLLVITSRKKLLGDGKFMCETLTCLSLPSTWEVVAMQVLASSCSAQRIAWLKTQLQVYTRDVKTECKESCCAVGATDLLGGVMCFRGSVMMSRTALFKAKRSHTAFSAASCEAW